jgi:hypothetical protein
MTTLDNNDTNNNNGNNNNNNDDNSENDNPTNRDDTLFQAFSNTAPAEDPNMDPTYSSSLISALSHTPTQPHDILSLPITDTATIIDALARFDQAEHVRSQTYPDNLPSSLNDMSHTAISDVTISTDVQNTLNAPRHNGAPVAAPAYDQLTSPNRTTLNSTPTDAITANSSLESDLLSWSEAELRAEILRLRAGTAAGPGHIRGDENNGEQVTQARESPGREGTDHSARNAHIAQPGVAIPDAQVSRASTNSGAGDKSVVTATATATATLKRKRASEPSITKSRMTISKKGDPHYEIPKSPQSSGKGRRGQRDTDIVTGKRLEKCRKIELGKVIRARVSVA